MCIRDRNTSDHISEINNNPSSESGELATEIDKITLANMIKIEKKAKKLSLLELTEKTCKWPIGDPSTSEFWFWFPNRKR